MTSRWARVFRGQVVAVVATFLAAFSHGAADGTHPPLVAIALALAFSSVACVLLASAHLSRVRLAASVTVSQLLYHGLFSLFGTAGTASGVITTSHHGPITIVPGATEAATSAVGPGMVVAHLVAAVLTFGVLLRGEQSLAAIAALAGLIFTSLRWWRLPQDARPVRAGILLPSRQRTAVAHRSLILTSSLSHRGPPVRPRFA